MPGPHCGKCASPLCGPGILMLGLASNEGLGFMGQVSAFVEHFFDVMVSESQRSPNTQAHLLVIGPYVCHCRFLLALWKLRSPEGSLRFHSAFMKTLNHCSANADTQVFDER